MTATTDKAMCKGRSGGTPADQDCDWPVCGCDPHADRVIETLQESGWAGPAERAALIESAEAHQAWAWAEAESGHNSTTFNERMELCKYAEWCTVRALAIASGDPAREKYQGVPHMVIWPAVYIGRAEQDEARAIVDRIMAAWRKSIRERRSA